MKLILYLYKRKKNKNLNSIHHLFWLRKMSQSEKQRDTNLILSSTFPAIPFMAQLFYTLCIEQLKGFLKGPIKI